MKLNELLGIEFPIIQGGMANVATGAFAAAVSNAGALGLIGSGGMDADALRREIQAAKSSTNKPFGVNLMLMNPHIEDLAKVVVEEGVQVVTTGAGNPGKYVPAWKEAGIKVFPVVAAPILAKRLERYGIDGGGRSERARHRRRRHCRRPSDGRRLRPGGLRRADRHLPAGQ